MNKYIIIRDEQEYETSGAPMTDLAIVIDRFEAMNDLHARKTFEKYVREHGCEECDYTLSRTLRQLRRG